MSLRLLEVRSRQDLKRWVRFPYEHYRGHPHFVPQLFREELAYFDRSKNPAFEVAEVKLFLALDGDRLVGRICAIVHSLETEKLGYKRGRFGWFESIDDQAVADLLLNGTREWLIEQGCVQMTGPHGFTDLDLEGLLVDGFDCTPTISGSYNHPYYAGLLENFGFEKDVDYLDYRFAVPDEIPFFERMKKRYANLEEYKVVTCRNSKELRGHLDDLWRVLHAAFEPLYGVMPLTPKQTEYYAKKYFGFLDPDFVKLLFHRDGELVAFLVGMPNLSHAFRKARGKLLPLGIFHILRGYRHPDTVDFLLAGSLPDHPTSLLTAIGLADMFDTLRARGVKFVEGNHELEDNTTVHGMWSRFPIVNVRRSRIFRLSLT